MDDGKILSGLDQINIKGYGGDFCICYLTALKGFGVLFSPMPSGWAGGWSGGWAAANILSGPYLGNIRCRKFIFGRNIG